VPVLMDRSVTNQQLRGPAINGRYVLTPGSVFVLAIDPVIGRVHCVGNLYDGQQ
jgi:hypothetical protein